MTAWKWCLAVVFLAVVSVPGGAMLPTAPAPAETEAPPPASALPLDETRDPAVDRQIESRIGEIFSEIPSLRNVRVKVSEGVVTLTGTAPDEAAINRAESIAGRFDVAAVENSVERDVSVDSGIGALESLKDRVTGWGKLIPLLVLALLVALVISAFGYLLASFKGFWRKVTPNPFMAELVSSAIRFVFVMAGVVVALDMLGAGPLLGAVLGGAGVVGIALGFAMRDTIENYVASLMLSLRQPFRANDHVTIDDQEGRVIRLTSRATVLMTLDGNHLRIPNGQVFKATIINFTTNPHRRFDFELGIDADDDPNAARQLGRDTLSALPFVLKEPVPEARTEAVGDSNIVIRFLAWIDQREVDWAKARSRAIAAVKTALEDGGFGLPEPIYRLRFDPRTGPLPFENIAENTGGKRTGDDAGQAQSAATAHTEPEDVSPNDDIAQMVDAERQEAPAGGESDLLDDSRPVE